MIDEDIILELSDILTELTYSLDKQESYEIFFLLKNLYDYI